MVLKHFRDLLDMAFKMYKIPSTETNAHSWQEPYVSKYDTRGTISLNCDNTNHWVKRPHASPAAWKLLKPNTLLGWLQSKEKPALCG